MGIELVEDKAEASELLIRLDVLRAFAVRGDCSCFCCS